MNVNINAPKSDKVRADLVPADAYISKLQIWAASSEA